MSIAHSATIEKVRQRRIAGPHQRGFDVANWSKALSEPNETPDVELLKESALILHGLMTELRSEAERLLSLAARPKWGLAGLVAWANLAGADLVRRMHNNQIAHDRSYFDVSDIVSARENANDGQADSIDELMMGIVDSLVYPIQHFLRTDTSDAVIDSDVDWDWPSIVSNANRYCIAYGLCQKAIYQRAYLSHIGQRVASVPADAYEAKLLAVSDFVGQERQAERSLIFNIESRERLSSSQSIAILPRRYVERLIPREHHYSVKTLNRRSAGNFQMPPSMIVAAITTSPGTVALLDHQIDGIAPGTLRQLVGAWLLLSEIAERWISTQSAAAVRNKKVLAATLVMPNKGLARMLADSIPCTKEVADSILKFLSFGGKTHDDLWTRPIIALDNEFSAIFISSLVISNTGRVIDSWVEGSRSAAAARGEYFESVVRREARAILKTSYSGSTTACAAARLELPNQQGEVDFLALINGVVFVGELKCQKHPADPAERHYYRATLHKAVNQVTKAASFLNSNRKMIATHLGFSDDSLVKSAPMLRFVLTNQYFCTGIAFSGVPVLQHEYFIEHLGDPKFVRSLALLAGTPPTATPYPDDFDAIVGDELAPLPHPRYQDVLSRIIPAVKRYSLRGKNEDFEEHYFWTKSSHEAGSFFSTPGFVIRR